MSPKQLNLRTKHHQASTTKSTFCVTEIRSFQPPFSVKLVRTPMLPGAQKVLF